MNKLTHVSLSFYLCVIIGYTGPFCGICDTGYYYDSFNQVCTICESDGVNVFSIVGLVIISVVAAVAVFYYAWDTLLVMLRFKIGVVNSVGRRARSTRDLALTIGNVQNKLKLLASTFQILLNLPSVLVLVFPDVYSSVLSIFSIVRH
jgi:hypothetical protein